MRSLRLLSLLLDYPTAAVAAARDQLAAAVESIAVDADARGALRRFVEHRCGGDLLDWQAEYDGLFERGRSLSLLLFEHVHGESRDRGQAMVDLLGQYRAAGLELDAHELPDYIPLYLEFLSTQGDDNARLGLQEIAHILALLACRLDQRRCDYAAIPHVLLQLSGAPVDVAQLHGQIVDERRDDTPEALDKVWEEEVVAFTGPDAAGACGTTGRPQPGQRRDREQPLHLA